MKKLVFQGSGVALVTPFTAEGINYEELGRLIDDQIAKKTDAIVVTGTTGEAATMTVDEHKKVIEFAVKHVRGRVPVIAGTGSNCTQKAAEMSVFAEKAGVDGLLVVTPFYNKCTQQGLIQHFNYIADRVNVPVILYNVPSRTGVRIEPATCKILAEHKNIVAIKEASGDISAVAAIRNLCGDELAVYSGNDDQIVPILSLGGKGVISVLANVAPEDTHEMCAAFFAGDTKKAMDLQLAYLDLIDALFCEVNPIPAKTALRLLGYEAGPLRLPLSEMTAEHKDLLQRALAKHKLI